MNNKRLLYRGYEIIEQDGYLYIYKNNMYIKRVFANWRSGLTDAKVEVDKIIKLYGN